MRRTRILLVDDNNGIRETLREIIEENPSWKICGEAAEGRSAVQLTRKLRPDLVVLDYHMPEMDGVEAARRILEVAPKIPIIFFTAEISRKVARHVLGIGVRGVVTKAGGGYLELLEWIEKLAGSTERVALPPRKAPVARKAAGVRSKTSRAN
jgi:DNA-binding NarL/FixJ family response regulator